MQNDAGTRTAPRHKRVTEQRPNSNWGQNRDLTDLVETLLAGRVVE